MRFERGKKWLGRALPPLLRHPTVGPRLLPWFVRAPKPFNAQIALTYQCQCDCVHCSAEMYRHQAQPDPETAQVRFLIRALTRTRAYKIYFFGGEPLLRRDILELIAFARQCGFQTMLDTNGLLLDQAMADRLKRAGLTEIGVSLDSADPRVHDRLRGVDGVFEKAVAGLDACVSAGLGAYITAYATPENLENGDLAAILSLAEDIGVPVRILSPVAAGKWLGEEEVKLEKKDVARLRALLRPGRVYWESVLCSSPDAPFICFSRIRAYVYLSPWGDVQPCNFIPVSFGNVFREPIETILRRMWSSPLFLGFEDTTDPSGCPMNDSEIGRRVARAVARGERLPLDYRRLL